ncbi:MAG: SseB family protein [Gammaproteobacteria bacterium]|nr:MAG: SseB family protein [Gammaproteobacteria bacterium]
MENFEPRNDLEQDLVRAQEGTISGEEFMQKLLESQVYMPILEESSHGISNFQTSQTAKPLSIASDSGEEFLIIFSSPERAINFVKDHPGYEGGLLTELTWIFEKIGVGFGISLNPDWPVGLDLEPEMVKQLAQSGHTA